MPVVSGVNDVLFQVLHVKSMSEWAPMCIGPYSQANMLGNSVVFVAGEMDIYIIKIILSNDYNQAK